MRIGLACEGAAPPAELLALLDAAGLPAALATTRPATFQPMFEWW